jgi:hypothetical protein
VLRRGETITNILGTFNRALFINLIALLFIVTAVYVLCLLAVPIVLPLAVSGGGSGPNGLAATPGASVFSMALALAVGIGMVLVAFGLFRRMRWSWLGTLLVSAALVVLILIQLLGGVAATGSAVLQILVFGAIFLLFLFDTEIKRLLWSRDEAPAA